MLWKLLLLTKNNLNSSIRERGPSKPMCDYGFCRHMWSKVIEKCVRNDDVVEGHKIYSHL
jgi:hypothetical protein